MVHKQYNLQHRPNSIALATNRGGIKDTWANSPWWANTKRGISEATLAWNHWRRLPIDAIDGVDFKFSKVFFFLFSFPFSLQHLKIVPKHKWVAVDLWHSDAAHKNEPSESKSGPGSEDYGRFKFTEVHVQVETNWLSHRNTQCNGQMTSGSCFIHCAGNLYSLFPWKHNRE